MQWGTAVPIMRGEGVVAEALFAGVNRHASRFAGHAGSWSGKAGHAAWLVNALISAAAVEHPLAASLPLLFFAPCGPAPRACGRDSDCGNGRSGAWPSERHPAA